MRLVQPPLIELRHYVMKRGQRDRMIELFAAQFVTPQDALGLPVLGQFRVVGDEDTMVWIRGFADMASRPERLTAFYGGSDWARFGAEAIAMVAAYDNVQLLREALPAGGIAVDLDARPPSGEPAACGVITATTYRVSAPPVTETLQSCRAQISASCCGVVLGLYVSEVAANNFPTLPIRQGEHLCTWFCGYRDAADVSAAIAPTALGALIVGVPEHMVLMPTARSALR